MRVENWCQPSSDPTLDDVRKLYRHSEDFVFRKNRYSAGDCYVGHGVPEASVNTLYVIKGSCKFWIPKEAEDSAIEVTEGQKLSEVSVGHAWRVTSNTEFEFVTVRELPDHLKGQGIR